jgi:hypothetical protein
VNYRAYGIVLSSAIPLPALAPAGDSSPSLHIVANSSGPDPDGWIDLPRRGTVGAAPWLEVATRGGEYRLVFDGGASFTLSADAATLTAYLEPCTSTDTLAHLLLDQVVPLVLSHQGRLVLHASAFAAPAGAVLLLGGAGAGKSTLSASFGRAGVPVLADDAVVLERRDEGLVALPAYAGLRVWPDSVPAVASGGSLPRVAPYTDKRRLGPAEGLAFAHEPVSVRRMYVLEEADEIAVRSLSRREAFIELVRHAYVLDATDRARLKEHFERMSAGGDQWDVKQLAYPSDLTALALVRAAVLEDLAQT